MTTNFFAPPACIQGERVSLPGEEARHAIRVLRKRPGDEIVVVDGEGGWYRVRLDHVDREAAAGHVVETRREVGEPACVLTIGLAVLKNHNRFETFLEKAVELGVREVIPLLTRRTERAQVKARRAEKILAAAMKQSGRSRLVRLAAPTPLDALCREVPPGARFLCHEQASPDQHITHRLAGLPAAPAMHVLVGPEGGFTDDEVAACQAAGFLPVSLGPRRLRAETAALVAAGAVMLWEAGNRKWRTGNGE